MNENIFDQNTNIPVVASYNQEYDVIDVFVFLNETIDEEQHHGFVIVYIPLTVLNSFSQDVETRDEQIAYYFSDSGYICDLYKTEFTEMKIHMM